MVNPFSQETEVGVQSAQIRSKLPEVFGKEYNQFLNLSRFVIVTLFDDADLYFRSDDPEPPNFYSSPGYGEGSVFENEFTNWVKSNKAPAKLEGYLAGFPQIVHQDGTHTDLLHLWADNSDVISTSFAVPLEDIGNLYVYPKLITSLKVEQDELAHRDVPSRYELPLLRDRKSGEVIWGSATMNDLEKTIGRLLLDQPPVLIVGNPLNHSSYTSLNPEQLKTLLDD